MQAILNRFARAAIQSRRIELDWSETPLHSLRKQPEAGHYINAMHLLVHIEFWFCRLFSQSMPQVDNDQLRAEMKSFMRQEAMHARAHIGLREHLSAGGPDVASFLKDYEWFFDVLLGDHDLKKYPWLKPVERWWLNQRLAIMAGLEHMTLFLAKWILANHDQLLDAGADPAVLDLLAWHSMEEIEHRTVAFDVHAEVSGSLAERRFWGAFSLAFMVYYWTRGASVFIQQDPAMGTRRSSLMAYWRGTRSGILPGPTSMVAFYLRYLRRDYHPQSEAVTEEVLARWEKTLPLVMSACSDSTRR